MTTEFVCDNIAVNEKGHLTFAGRDTLDLAAQYGTPLYLTDEERIRHNCRIYKEAFAKYFPEGSCPAYASKAASFKAIYRIMAEEKMHVDVASCGELYTALKAGYDLKDAFFHGNNKTDADIHFAMDNGIGCFVADNEEEVLAVEREAAARGIRQRILLRITPGIDPHTYAAISTGQGDSKFGAAIETGQAETLARMTLSQEHIQLDGFHCHIGSQVFAEDVFERTVKVMLEFIASIKEKTGYEAPMLDLGGGYGVRYVTTDPYLDIGEKIASVAEVLKAECARLGLKVPAIMMEPGRSIVADAGMTLYTAGTVKRITGYKNYVSIDGGMTDNPRYALYGARYTVLAAGKMLEENGTEFTIAGHNCESGDVIQEKVPLPDSMGRGDIVAVCTTGAYNYSMASNYNRYGRPAMIMLAKDREYTAIRRETLDDLLQWDV